MSYEQKIINYFEKNYKKIGDDCAYINTTKQLISSDTLVENKHFDLKHFTPQNIAHRLFLSNYSDIQSSGGVPKYVLLNISFPNKKSTCLTMNSFKILSSGLANIKRKIYR